MKDERWAGLTLLETIIALLIAAIVCAGFGTVAGRSRSGMDLQMAADQLVQEIRGLQQRALTEQCSNYFILFDRASGSYYLRKSGFPDVTLSRVYLPRTVALENTNFDKNKLYISAQGLPYPRGGTVTLRDKRNSKFKYVIIASVTGRVRSSDTPPESWEIGK
ncbi:MAG: pilus assembly FimT family protein [Thermacetogeniaceae bacterium]